MICIYFVLIWTLSLCNLCNIGLENKVIIIPELGFTIRINENFQK